MYSCERCGKIFDRKFNYDRHCNRVTKCDDVKRINECQYCKKVFGSKYNTIRHENGCKMKVKVELENKINILKNQIDTIISQNNGISINKQSNVVESQNNIGQQHIEKQTVNNIGKQVVNNIENQIINKTYINIVPYGKEDITFMSEVEILHFLFMGVMSIPELVKFIHFNKNKPEFHNFYISNIKSKYAKKFDGKKWNMCDKNDAIEEEFIRACEFLENMYVEYKEKDVLGELTISKMEKFMVRKDEKDYMEKMAAKILLVLYNNRDIVENTIRNNSENMRK